MPHGKGLGEGDETGVTGRLEGGGAARHEAGEFGGGAVAVKDGLVTDDDQLDEVELTPADDVADLALGAGDTGVGDPDTEDDLQAIIAGGGSDVLEGAAVGAVDADRGESLLCDDGEVGGDGAGVLAATTRGVRRVGHGPGVAVGGDATRTARATVVATARLGSPSVCAAGRSRGGGRARSTPSPTTGGALGGSGSSSAGRFGRPSPTLGGSGGSSSAGRFRSPSPTLGRGGSGPLGPGRSGGRGCGHSRGSGPSSSRGSRGGGRDTRSRVP